MLSSNTATNISSDAVSLSQEHDLQEAASHCPEC